MNKGRRGTAFEEGHVLGKMSTSMQKETERKTEDRYMQEVWNWLS